MGPDDIIGKISFKSNQNRLCTMIVATKSLDALVFKKEHFVANY